jgi:hypothetical protein
VITDPDRCPAAADHTPCPKPVAEWVDWSRRQWADGWHPEPCPTCEKYVIWIKEEK